MSGQEWALILTPLAPVIVAITSLIVVFRKSSTTQASADKSAVAVSTVTETKDKVDILLDAMELLQGQVSELKQLREADAKQIAELTAQLSTERTAHTETRRKLDKAIDDLKTKDAQITKLKQQIDDLQKVSSKG
jgi:septal ring factor EnvC (AmiA/AmiB activator)